MTEQQLFSKVMKLIDKESESYDDDEYAAFLEQLQGEVEQRLEKIDLEADDTEECEEA